MSIKKAPFFWLLLLSMVLFTIFALLGRDSIYDTYKEKENLQTTPLLACVFEGFYDGIMPWDAFTLEGEPDAGDFLADASATDSDSAEAENPTIETADDDAASIDETAGNQADSPNTEGEMPPEITDDMPPEPPPELNPDGTPIELDEYGMPIVHYAPPVTDSYFEDAVFIGDSRTRSLELYSGIENTTFLASTGLSIYSVLDVKLTPSDTSEKTTVVDYLSEHQFRKIYLMLGINELGRGTAEQFAAQYRDVIDTLHELEPDALIIVQAILHVSAEKEAEGTYINNEAIIERNALLSELADNRTIFYLDANEAICDPDGFLIKNYTFDGVHLQAKYVSVWVNWLKTHAIAVMPTQN